MRGLLADLTHSLRIYRRTPVASCLAVVALAVAMAFVTAFLSMYVDLVLRPHPGFERSGRIATVGQSGRRQLAGIPFGIVERMAAEMASIDTAVMSSAMTPYIGPERELVLVERVSRGFFEGLQPRLVLGRGFREADHALDAEPVAVISYRLWRERFAADPDIIETTLDVAVARQDAVPFRIVGVMNQAVPSLLAENTSLWIPLERAVPLFAGDEGPSLFNPSLPDVLGVTYVHRSPGVSAEAVASEFRSRYLGEDSPFSVGPGMTLDAIEGIVRDIDVHRAAKRQLQMFLAGSILLSLVAAANVSLFLLAREHGRRRELGIRMAVGARIVRLARQLATEASLLVLASAALGVLLSVWLADWLAGLSLLREAEWRDVTLLDWRVFVFVGGCLFALCALVSLTPILGIKKLGIAVASRRTAARASLTQRLVGTVQLAIAGTVSGAAIALGWHLGSLLVGNAGYETVDRYMVEGVGGPIFNRDRSGTFVELARRREAIEAIPGVNAVAFGSPVPGEESPFPAIFRLPDPIDPATTLTFYFGSLEHQYIDLLGLTLIRGRAPENGEMNVALVNQSFAREAWGHDDIVGERLSGVLQFGNEGSEIIGVLEDMSFEHPLATVKPTVFATLGTPGIRTSAVIEARLSAAELKEELSRIASVGELEFEVGNVFPLKGMRNELIATDRARGFLTIASATLVVALAAFGFYGMQRYLVATGRREYAIRASLGAGPNAIGKLVIGRGLGLALPGLALAAMLAFIVVASLRGDFVSRSVSPAVVAVSVVVGFGLLLAAASLGPALQAMHTRPAPLLRED